MPSTGKPDSTTLENVLKRDRAIILAGLLGLAALGWVYLAVLAADMNAMSMPGARIEPWSSVDFALMFLMWAVMMVAMMVPSAAPLVLIYARIHRQQQERARPFAPTGAFAAGYILAWTAFSLVATIAQWALERAALLSPMMVSTSSLLGGALLVAAGVYQLTPLKYACLSHCRSPIQFVMHHWRSGVKGALRMGVEHGFYCIGCCWFLMGLLFVGGIMNLLWIAAISVFVLLEKLLRQGEIVARVTGAVLIVGGLYVAVA